MTMTSMMDLAKRLISVDGLDKRVSYADMQTILAELSDIVHDDFGIVELLLYNGKNRCRRKDIQRWKEKIVNENTK